MPLLKKLVSGGQTGADRAALDAALDAGVDVGGWCPRGRRAEDGPISTSYPLRETPSPDVRQRTAWNVRDSDGTLILLLDDADQGTDFTRQKAHDLGRPVVEVVLPAGPSERKQVAAWLVANEIEVLNVAGPRESNARGLYEAARCFLSTLLRRQGDAG
ncbi:MAG: molybdenum cofactor carrier [Bacteroidetes bacterium]|jgi:hypothetical protein|nr:molybdenum cofactor carrier [Bacteroidota bacterium]